MATSHHSYSGATELAHSSHLRSSSVSCFTCPASLNAFRCQPGCKHAEAYARDLRQKHGFTSAEQPLDLSVKGQSPQDDSMEPVDLSTVKERPELHEVDASGNSSVSIEQLPVGVEADDDNETVNSSINTEWRRRHRTKQILKTSTRKRPGRCSVDDVASLSPTATASRQDANERSGGIGLCRQSVNYKRRHARLRRRYSVKNVTRPMRAEEKRSETDNYNRRIYDNDFQTTAAEESSAENAGCKDDRAVISTTVDNSSLTIKRVPNTSDAVSPAPAFQKQTVTGQVSTFSLSPIGSFEKANSPRATVLPGLVSLRRLKRFCCMDCPYRSNFRSDVVRHIRFKHPQSSMHILVMDPQHAAATLHDYLNTWTKKKFVLWVKGEDRESARDDAIGTPKDQSASDVHRQFLAEEQQSTSSKVEVTSLGHENAGLDVDATGSESSQDQTTTSSWDETDVNTASFQNKNVESSGSTSSSIKSIAKTPIPLVNGKSSRFRCQQCPYVSRNRYDYLYHRQFHDQQAVAAVGGGNNIRRTTGARQFKCELCEYWVSERRLLTQHYKVHRPDYQLKHSTPSVNGRPPFPPSEIQNDTRADAGITLSSGHRSEQAHSATDNSANRSWSCLVGNFASSSCSALDGVNAWQPFWLNGGFRFPHPSLSLANSFLFPPVFNSYMPDLFAWCAVMDQLNGGKSTGSVVSNHVTPNRPGVRPTAHGVVNATQRDEVAHENSVSEVPVGDCSPQGVTSENKTCQLSTDSSTSVELKQLRTHSKPSACSNVIEQSSGGNVELPTAECNSAAESGNERVASSNCDE